MSAVTLLRSTLPLPLVETIARGRTFLSELGAALGSNGAKLAVATGALGLSFCLISVACIGIELHSRAAERERLTTGAVAVLDNDSRLLVRTIVGLSPGRPDLLQPEASMAEAWQELRRSLDKLCDLPGAQSPGRLEHACAARALFYGRAQAEMEAFDPSRRMLDPIVLRDLLAIRGDINRFVAHIAGTTDRTTRSMVDDHGLAIAVASIGVVGCLGAGLALTILLGRASVLHCRQRAEAQAARGLLQETIDALPAGVVVYDRDERLVLLNRRAREVAPVLARGNPLGCTYEELTRQAARDMEAAGYGPQPIEDWLARFRGRGSDRALRPSDGRWFDWSEQVTPNGYTVGLRVDVTEAQENQFDLERERSRYSELVGALSDLVYTLDSRGTFTFASDSAQALLGLPAARLLGKGLHEFIMPDDLPYAKQVARDFLTNPTSEVCRADLKVRRADGAIRHMAFRWRAAPDALGRQAVAVGVMRDVTERVELAEQLANQAAETERARAEYQALVDQVDDTVITVNVRDGAIKYAGGAARSLYGRQPSELIGTRFLDYIVPEDRPQFLDVARHGGGANSYRASDDRFGIRRADGSVRHVDARIRRGRDSQGHDLLIGVMRDVEDKVRLERQLAAEMENLRSIVESSGALVLLVDGDLTIKTVNSGFAVATGIAQDQAVGQLASEVLGCQLDRHAVRPQRFAVKMADPHGQERLFSITATPVRDRSGLVSNIVLLGFDDTERLHAETALHDVERFATVGEMAAMMAHEISQPLSVINLANTSAADELDNPSDEAKGPDSAYVKARLGRIDEQVQKAGRIINEFRSFVRGTGSSDPPTCFALGDVIRHAASLMSYSLRQAGVALDLAVPTNLPPLLGHPGRLEQVLINLINNARDAGGRAIEISAEAVKLKDTSFVRVAIDDTGPGIPAELLPRLFVSFVTTKAAGKGTGLGLRVCKRIVEEMGGTISAANRPQGGARFEIVLPSHGIWMVASATMIAKPTPPTTASCQARE